MAILIVEDDAFYGSRLIEALNDGGTETLLARTAEEAVRIDSNTYDAAIIDVMLPNDPATSGITVEETRGGYMTGVALARRLRKARAGLKLALITGDAWNSEAEQWATSQDVPILKKYDSRRLILDNLRRVGFLSGSTTPKAFIVHGHDEAALLQLKNYVQNVLHWDEPVVLREQPNCGRTLIEKFEDCSDRIDCVFVLLTPDDASISSGQTEPRRSRQNVVFELGFFFGQFGRDSGRIIVLYKGPNELPSDIHGIAWIGIEHGIEAAGEEIRREVARFSSRSS